jgi:hypothetical protein
MESWVDARGKVHHGTTSAFYGKPKRVETKEHRTYKQKKKNLKQNLADQLAKKGIHKAKEQTMRNLAGKYNETRMSYGGAPNHQKQKHLMEIEDSVMKVLVMLSEEVVLGILLEMEMVVVLLDESHLLW